MKTIELHYLWFDSEIFFCLIAFSFIPRINNELIQFPIIQQMKALIIVK